MTFHEISAASNSIGFYCDECEHVGNGPIIYNSPSFFSDFTVSPHEQATMIRCIKNVFIGSHVPLTQRKMEEFFHNDAHFVQATPGLLCEGSSGGLMGDVGNLKNMCSVPLSPKLSTPYVIRKRTRTACKPS